MSSPPRDKIETKAGHLPAVKAGGMRIVQKHQPTPVPEPVPKDDKDDEEYETARALLHCCCGKVFRVFELYSTAAAEKCSVAAVPADHFWLSATGTTSKENLNSASERASVHVAGLQQAGGVQVQNDSTLSHMSPWSRRGGTVSMEEEEEEEE
ncbi:hypothetical protein CRUP_031908, partial [Coryphaenoides rupestris]